jgi:leucyl-tRNA synthetase
MPVWVSDFVLAGFGTGAVVGVPGHDMRDFQFAQQFDLPIVRVVAGTDGDTSDITKAEQVQEHAGKMINSGPLDGLDIHEATEKMKDLMEEQGMGTRTHSYRIRDWLISRQRYWGAPIPIVHCSNVSQEIAATPTADDTADTAELRRSTHRAIKRVSDDLANMGFNTAIAALMECLNELYKAKQTIPFDQAATTWRWTIESFLQLLAPFAPHITEELWAELGHTDSIHISDWPKHDEQYLLRDTMTIVVQVNGKVRGEVEMPSDAAEEQVVAAAKANEKVASYLQDATIRKTIYIAKKLVSFVV